jgi:uncharacterized RmlC-like cupin family protein
MTFVTPDGEVTASEGDLMTVPPGAIHTFKNASETEDAACYMTATPGMKCVPVAFSRRVSPADSSLKQVTMLIVSDLVVRLTNQPATTKMLLLTNP